MDKTPRQSFVSDHYLRVLFPDVLPYFTTVESSLNVSEDSCLSIEITTSIHDARRTLGGLALYVRLSKHSQSALILHINQDVLQAVDTCEVDIPAGNYSFSLTAKGNMVTELGIDNLLVQPGPCTHPRKQKPISGRKHIFCVSHTMSNSFAENI